MLTQNSARWALENDFGSYGKSGRDGLPWSSPNSVSVSLIPLIVWNDSMKPITIRPVSNRGLSRNRNVAAQTSLAIAVEVGDHTARPPTTFPVSTICARKYPVTAIPEIRCKA